MHSLADQATAGVKWTAGSIAVVSVLQIIQLAVLARFLSPNDFGLMAIAMLFIGFAQNLVDLGVSGAVIHDQRLDQEELSGLYWLSLASGVSLYALAWLFAPLVALLYREPRLESLSVWAAAVLVLMPIGLQHQVLMQRELRFRVLAQVEVASALAGTVVAILTALRGEGAFALVWGSLANAATRALLLAVEGLRWWRPLWGLKHTGLRRYLRFGLFQMGERTLSFVGWRLDRVVIGLLLGAEPLGHYSVAYQLMMKPFSALSPILGRVGLPVFARLQGDDERLGRAYTEMVRVIASVVIPVYAGMVALATPLFSILVGAGWEPAVSVFRILALLGVVYCLETPVGILLLAKGRADIVFFFNLLMFAMYGVAIAFAARVGLSWIAWSLVFVTAAVLFPLAILICWRLIRIRPASQLHAFAPFVSMSAAMGAAVYLLSILIAWPSVTLNLLVCGLVGGLCYAAMMHQWQGPFFGRLRDRAGQLVAVPRMSKVSKH